MIISLFAIAFIITMIFRIQSYLICSKVVFSEETFEQCLESRIEIEDSKKTEFIESLIKNK